MISKEALVFWSILEFDLKMKIPCYIKNSFTLCNLESAAVFISVDKNDINNVQDFIRNKLYDILQDKCKENNLEYEDKYNVIFFGLFSSLREKFEFSVGDLKKLNVIIAHIVKKVSENNNDFSYFDVSNKKNKNQKSWDNVLVKTPAGMFFGDRFENANSKFSMRDINELKKTLFTKALAHLKSFETLKIVNEFNENSVIVFEDSGKFKGKINCPFCDSSSVVSYNVNGKTGSCSFSNLIRHVKQGHLAPKKTELPDAEVSRKRTSHVVLTMIEHQEKMQKVEEKTHDSNDITLALEIEPAFPQICQHEMDEQMEKLEDAFYLQCSTQMIKMKNTCISNSEKIEDFYSRIPRQKLSSNNVKCCRISGLEGNCLFGSIAHQLFQMKINSSKHKECIHQLRQEVVHHILLHLPRFIHCLKGRVFDENDKDSAKTIQRKRKTEQEKQQAEKYLADQCKLFVEKKLAGNIWGGTETIRALSEIYKINILIINDNGTCNMSQHFEAEFKQTIILAYLNGNHYDSIVAIDDETILDYAKTVVINQNKLNNNQNLNVIELD